MKLIYCNLYTFTCPFPIFSSSLFHSSCFLTLRKRVLSLYDVEMDESVWLTISTNANWKIQRISGSCGKWERLLTSDHKDWVLHTNDVTLPPVVQNDITYALFMSLVFYCIVKHVLTIMWISLAVMNNIDTCYLHKGMICL